MAVFLEAYTEEKVKNENRVIMRFPYWMAPIKVAVFPLLKNNKDLVKKAKEIFEEILPFYEAQYDESGAIGRRYRRHDEVGTPVCVTIDHDTLEDNTVTLRDRDTMKQVRVSAGNLKEELDKVLQLQN